MKKIMVFLLSAICILGFAGCQKQDSFEVRIHVPAESSEEFVYSHEEISPKGKTIQISCGEGLGDTSVVLKPVDGNDENKYEPTYLTPGMPVKVEADKGEWFKVGVSAQNKTDAEQICSVKVEGVEVRIEDRADENIFGITLTADHIMPTGMTLKCSQSESKISDELYTGSWFVVEKWTQKDGWKEVKYNTNEEIVWTEEGWIVPLNDTVAWEVNWDWIYGKLPKGKYRIGKEFMGTKENSQVYYAEFEILEE